MGFKTGPHGKVYNDEKSTKGSSGSNPGNNDGSSETVRDDSPSLNESNWKLKPNNTITLSFMNNYDGMKKRLEQEHKNGNFDVKIIRDGENFSFDKNDDWHQKYGDN
ncbi:MAG: hypothetical protein HOD60_08915 [Candidatus Nitrosopelagicus sp.]|jgi:hypothetical protein|nr:hypothetical protein [Candidatus Nitrosopelagicus sp.]